MPTGQIDIRAEGARELVRVSALLREHGRRDLLKEMNAEIREQAKPVVDDLRSAIKGVRVTSSRGGGSRQRYVHRGSRGKFGARHGLRATIAASIQTKIATSGPSTGVKIRVDSTRMPPDQKPLPWAINRPAGWAHPVFGHRDRQVTQRGQEWWTPTIERHAATVRQGVLAALNRWSDRLAAECNT